MNEKLTHGATPRTWVLVLSIGEDPVEALERFARAHRLPRKVGRGASLDPVHEEGSPMLRSAEGMRGNKIVARDGEIGIVHDLLFDDETWTVRYLVVDTRVIGGRRVLVSPIAVEAMDGLLREIRASLTVEEIELSPSIDTDAPVHRQQERAYFDHFGWPYYWGMGGLWGPYPAPRSVMKALRDEARARGEPDPADDADPHLRSAREVKGYHIRATDGSIGHVEDFILDEESWAIRYLVVDTRNWWFGKEVLVAPDWAEEISWDDREVAVGHTREEIRSAPAWRPTDLINREYEVRLYDAYGRPGYWEADRDRGRLPSHPLP